MVIQGLLMYFIINKRKLELDDIGKGKLKIKGPCSAPRTIKTIYSCHFYCPFQTGMNAVSLQQFLTRQPSLLAIVFPPHDARNVSSSQMKSKLSYESRECDKKQAITKSMFEQYIEEIAIPREGKQSNPYGGSIQFFKSGKQWFKNKA